MASEDESQAGDKHHDDKDWELHKEQFRVCYIDNNMTRKDAAQYLKDNFGFDATPRQWERKIKQWGFSKYSSREDRLHQIASTGKSIYEVGRPGRRPRSAHMGEEGKLHPYEDRNLRRFARREASRSRSRSRSASFTDRPRPRFQNDLGESSSTAIIDQTFNLNLANPTAFHPPSQGFTVAATPAAGKPEQPVQLHLLHEQKASAFGDLEEPELFLTVDDSQYGASNNQDQFPDFSGGLMPVGSSLGTDAHTPDLQFSMGQNDPTINYAFPNDSSANFDTYAVSTNIDNGLVNNGMMGDQLYNDVRLSQGQMNQSIMDNIPTLIFDAVDPDPIGMVSQLDETDFSQMSDMADIVSLTASENSGPLQNDVMPLIEEYTRDIQAAAWGWVTSQQYIGTSGDKLAASLDQPGQVFKVRMTIMLENFASSQQRALQAMRDRCNRLKKKNETLEEFINTSESVKICEICGILILCRWWCPACVYHISPVSNAVAPPAASKLCRSLYQFLKWYRSSLMRSINLSIYQPKKGSHVRIALGKTKARS
ncbi:hypothetical protein EDD37DRAFT_169443 [Exophiala viscosa]|uniref:uncharacterized protein n=1 Tax=Exophiala viscosa TaxID=2486360 RepID=UPI0021988A55|nr:hypothetical protein EDD37DRAFT_169443 [Exophiala viscosa]